MNVKEIIENFKSSDGNKKLMKQSILEARKNKEEVTELLLEELDKIACDIEKYSKDNDMLHIYIMFLLAEFREKRAFPIIIKFITNDQEKVRYLLEDFITEELYKLLASTFDGNIDMICDVISNLELDEYVRSAAFKALAIQGTIGIVSHEEILKRIEEMLENKLKEDDSIVIYDFIKYIADNNIYDKIDLVRKLYKEDRVPRDVMGDYDAYVDYLYSNNNRDDDLFVEDMIYELTSWGFFEKDDDYIKQKKIKKEKLKAKENKKENNSNEVVKNQKIGRNDKCICGSGKKYKQCCLKNEEKCVVTPADEYINKALARYPKEEISKFYDDETIEIDFKLYYVFRHKPIPLFEKRNYQEEKRRNNVNFTEALELMKIKCEKENIDTMEEYDKKLAIHYTLYDIIYNYFMEIERDNLLTYDQIRDKKIKFFLKLMEFINFSKEFKVNILSGVLYYYLEDYNYYNDYDEDEQKLIIKKLINELKEKYISLEDVLNEILIKNHIE